MSRFGGNATVVPASAYVSTFSGTISRDGDRVEALNGRRETRKKRPHSTQEIARLLASSERKTSIAWGSPTSTNAYTRTSGNTNAQEREQQQLCQGTTAVQALLGQSSTRITRPGVLKDTTPLPSG
jgi:hypothetical protein